MELRELNEKLIKDKVRYVASWDDKNNYLTVERQTGRMNTTVTFIGKWGMVKGAKRAFMEIARKLNAKIVDYDGDMKTFETEENPMSMFTAKIGKPRKEGDSESGNYTLQGKDFARKQQKPRS